MTKRAALSVLPVALLLCPIVAAAHMPDGMSQAQIDAALKFGAIAAVTPLCGLRDTAWASDLWRASLLALGGQASAPGADATRRGDQAGAVLSYAEDEALEAFAEAAPGVTCGPLAHDPDLKRADDMVGALRNGTGQAVW